MYTVVILTFIAVYLICSALFLGFTAAKESPAAELKRRLRIMARNKKLQALPDDLRAEIIKETPPFELFISHVPFLRNTDKWLDHAGLKFTPARFLLLTLTIAVTGFTIVFAIQRNYLIALLVGLIVLAIPFAYLVVLKRQREDKFTEQLPDVLTMISRSLRAGHSINSAIELVGKEMPEPAGELFKTAFEQQKLGLPAADTLANMTLRIESLDLRFFVVVISINSEVGGNLAEILDKLAETIRERLKIRRQVKVYTAQGRMSGYLLAALPIVTFIIFTFLMPGYEDVLTKEKPGQYILVLAALLQITGFLLIRKIINIRI
ncbi:MAG TPA: type II secretion system F family protein [Geobacteraceae bacterium]